MADLPVHWKSVKVLTGKAFIFCSASCSLHSEGVFGSFTCVIYCAYIAMVQLDDRIQESYMEAFSGKAATAAMLTHLRRELVQAVWMLLMDDEFMHAYIHGFLFQLADGILRVLFPRFLTYSADYPEK